jgi:hypothetical protein
LKSIEKANEQNGVRQLRLKWILRLRWTQPWPPIKGAYFGRIPL